MSESMLSVLELVRESFPPTLIDEQGYARLAAVASRLPERLGTFWIIECCLGRPEAVVDASFEAKSNSQGQQLLAGQLPSSLDMMCMEWPIWRKVRQFADLWANPSYQFFDNIGNLWLEFDTAKASSSLQLVNALRQPCIFFGPKTEKLDHEQLYRLIREALGVLGEPGLGDSTLSSFIRLLPENARLFQVGLMFSRPNSGLRVCVNRLAPEKIADWFVELKWGGDIKSLAAILQQITPLLNHITVDLNLTENGVANKIGLECYVDWREMDGDLWIPFMRLLENMDLCLPQKRQGVLDFPGICRSPFKERLSRDGMLHSYVFRKIHHLKLIVSGDQILEAKAYLAFIRLGARIEIFKEQSEISRW